MEDDAEMKKPAKDRWLAEEAKAKAKKPRKYRNVRCQDKQGRWFDSKTEMRNHLALEAHHGYWNVFRQVSLIVSDGPRPIRIIIDHIVKQKDGGWKFYDTKGQEPTQAWKNKAKMLFNKYAIEITILK